MKINGVELDFTLYDSANAEMKQRYFEELNKMRTVSQEIPKEATEKVQTEYLCNRIKRMFDTVFGKGTGEKVCGTTSNLLVCMDAYDQLVSEQIRQNKEYESIMNHIKGMTGQVLGNESAAGKVS